MNTHVTQDLIPDLTHWIGRSTMAHGSVSSQAAAMIHATVGRPDMPCPRLGNALPLLWHWYAFAPMVAMQDLAEDGHPAKGGFLPPIPYERRMWASGDLHFYAPLRVGETIERRSVIANVVEKRGRSGGMAFVSVNHEYHGDAGLAVRERQEIVYLPIPRSFTPPPKQMAPSADLLVDRAVDVNPALLFRYSAITFNAHRIHYDLPYAQKVEAYPGLVVHGPLQAQLLAQEATELKGRAPSKFKFRGIHPMFHQGAMSLRATAGEEGTVDLCTAAGEGHIGVKATASWEGL